MIQQARAVVFLLSMVLVLPSIAGSQPAPAAEMLVSTAWLARHLTDPGVAISAATDAGEYASGHIPGARMISHEATLGPSGHVVTAPDALAIALARAGARDDVRIVVYGGPMESGWIYMVLASLGHADHVSLLSGNLAAWKADGHPVSRDPVPPAAGRLTPRPTSGVVVDAPWVRERLEDKAVRVLDVRSERERAGGYLPGTPLVLWKDLYQDSNQFRFKSREELRALLDRAGVRPGQQVVTYCAVGMRASLMYFAARYAGHDARVYVGSWQDWSARPGYPVVR